MKKHKRIGRVLGDTSTESNRPPHRISLLPPRLSNQEAQECVQWILSDEAVRPAQGRGKRQRFPFKGEHICYQGKHLRFRNSDRAEREAVSVSILVHAGEPPRHACVDVASKLKKKLGKSRRGHPRSSEFVACELDDKAETVRGLWKKFWRPRLGALPREQIVRDYFWGWWQKKYSETHPEARPRGVLTDGDWSEAIADIRARQDEAIKAMLPCLDSGNDPMRKIKTYKEWFEREWSLRGGK